MRMKKLEKDGDRFAQIKEVRRRKEVSSYLTENLNKKYFGQKRKTYQNANGTFSKLESLEIYPKEAQGTEIEGLVVACYENKHDGYDWIIGKNIFKVQCNNEIKKFTNITSPGSYY
jgi:hypothetical protein